jgi:hypothetical protein
MSSNEPTELRQRKFIVIIEEIKQSLVPAEIFAGSFERTVTLSNGAQRRIKLTPMMHNEMEVVELCDSGHRSHMGPNGTTLNGNVMIRLIDADRLRDDDAEMGKLGPIEGF